MKNVDILNHNYQTLKITLLKSTSNSKSAPITQSKDINRIMKKKADSLDRECFWALPIDSKNRIIGINLVSMGSLDRTVIHPREIFKLCFLTNATRVILVHNHTSGDSKPSYEDISTTQILKDAGEILNIEVLDHIIIGENDYFSFADSSLLKTTQKK